MDSDDKKPDPETESALIAVPEKTNGRAPVAVDPDAEPLSQAVRRLRRYFNKPVAVQLKRALVILDYAGEAQVGDQRFGLLGPAMLRTPEGNDEPVGSHFLLPTVFLNPAPNGCDLVAWMQSPVTSAMIEVLLDPADIEFVTFVARLPPPPSSLVLPKQN